MVLRSRPLRFFVCLTSCAAFLTMAKTSKRRRCSNEKTMSSSSNMDVDSPRNGHSTSGKALDIHPLVLVHMSDHFTRITCGGSPLPSDAPVVGLLFGSGNKISHADDIGVAVQNKTATQQVSLHQAVFPQHRVVGWYRVVTQDQQVTQEDVRITQELQQHYADADGKEQFVFLLLQVNNNNATASTSEQASQELPLSIYELASSPPVLVEIAQKWQLATFEPERIAMERVVREQPNTEGQQERESKFATHLDTVEQSLLAMKERVQILMQYLEEQEQQQTPSSRDLYLLRQIQGLVYQLGPLMNSASASKEEETELLSHLGSVAKMTCAIQGYTNKFRTVHERSNPSREGATSRRF